MSNTFFQGGKNYVGGFLPPALPLVTVLYKLYKFRQGPQKLGGTVSVFTTW